MMIVYLRTRLQIAPRHCYDIERDHNYHLRFREHLTTFLDKAGIIRSDASFDISTTVAF